MGRNRGGNNRQSQNFSFAPHQRAKQNLSFTSIYAPIDGVVIERNVNNGQTVCGAPLLYSGVQIEPSVENRLRAGSAILPLMFRLYNLPGPPDQWDLEAKARLLGETGKEYVLDPISLKKAVSAAGDGEAAVVLNLSFHDVQPGKYRLIIETSDLCYLSFSP